MQAIIIEKFGGIEELKYQTVPKPTLSSPNQILVRLKAAGLNPVDTKQRTNFDKGGDLPNNQSYIILGYDGAGTVEEVGSEVKRFKVGHEVYFSGELTKNGTNAQYTVVDERLVGHRPKSLTWEQSAVVPLIALTAYEGLVEKLGIPIPNALEKSDKTILVIGGAGGVGGLVIQIASRILKLRVVATAGRPESEQSARNSGAHDIIDYNKDMHQQLKDLGYPNGEVDYIYNTISTKDYLPRCADIIRPLGRIVNIVECFTPLDIGSFFFKGVQISWELMFTRGLYGIQQEVQGKILDDLAPLYDNGTLDPRLAKIYEWNQIVEAHKAQESGKLVGKVALKIPE
jgi:NADPH2:quinone reductase